MAFYAPDPVQSTQLIPGGNTPASGALLFCYSVGTTAKQNTYTDASASTARTNPIVLDSGGNIPGNGEVWIASSAKFVLAPSNDTDPPNSPYWTRDNLPGVNNVSALVASSAAGEWVQGSTATFVGVTAFSVAGDQTALYTLGRRIKATVTGGDRFGIVTSSVFGANTAVGVTLDSSTLNAGLNAVWYGLLSTPNGSVPWESFTTSGINELAPITFLSVAQNEALTNVTAAISPNIWNGGNVINYVGTTAATTFANAPQAGARRTLILASPAAFSSTAALGIGGGSSSYTATSGDKVDVIAISTNTFTIYPLSNSGSWTPTVLINGAGAGITYAAQLGEYAKIANMVAVEYRVLLTSTGTATSGSVQIAGLPFLPFASRATGAVHWLNMSSSIQSMIAVNIVGSTLTLFATTSGATSMAAITEPMLTNNAIFQGSLVYMT